MRSAGVARRRPVPELAEGLLMGKPLATLGVRVLSLQMTAHALIFAAQNAGGFAERALLADDTASTAALGLSWTAFGLLYAFTTNVVSVCPLVVGRCAGGGDPGAARAAARGPAGCWLAVIITPAGGPLKALPARRFLQPRLPHRGLLTRTLIFLTAQSPRRALASRRP
jgi:hypothetical protein